MRTLCLRVAAASLCAALAPTAFGQDAPRSYIVVLQPGTGNPRSVAAGLARTAGGELGFVYEHALQGFSINASPQAARALARNPLVSYVEEDMVRSIDVQTIPTGVRRIFADDNASIDIDASDDYRVDVDVAVIDTGVDWQHPDLNVVGGINCASGNPFRASCSGNGDDDHYHGTHVGGTIAALDNGIGVVGVAPGARLWAVKVLNSQGSGYASWIVAGIDWVAARAGTIEVANMSLGGTGFNQAEYDAIQGAVNKGVAFAVSAGNSADDASKYSPAAFNNVLTVSALADFNGEPGGGAASTCRSDQDDTLADFSNWGPAVNISAPGVCILSTYPIERGEYGTISGTSMASPHVAGALALLASAHNPANASDVANLYSQVVSAGNLNWTDDSGDGIKEPLLDVSGFTPALIPGSGSGGGENSPPSASFSFSCNELSCSFTDTSTDTDGTVTAWSWNFGDGGSATSQNPGHTYAAGGTYTVSLTVTDDDSVSASTSQSVTVSAAPSGGVTLGVTAYKVKGVKYADLTWSGATSNNVDVKRNGSLISTTANDGSHTDGPLGKGGGSATYVVCEAGTSTCSSQVMVSW